MAKKPSMQAARVRLGKLRSLDKTAMLAVVSNDPVVLEVVLSLML
jgi:hypothetical protein